MNGDISWIRESLTRIEKKLDRINSTLQEHEKRISRLEGANRIWIPVSVGLISMAVGVLIGHITL